MRGLILIGFLIIFVSTMFMMLFFLTIVRANVTCIGSNSNPTQYKCNIAKYNVDLIFGLLMIGLFMMLDVGAIYLVFVGI